MVKTSLSGSTTSRYSPCQSTSPRASATSIVSRHAPPARTSIDTLENGTTKSGPPNQSANRPGSVHSNQTCVPAAR